MLIDSTIVGQKSETGNLAVIEERLDDQREIISGMVEAAICQVSHHCDGGPLF
jgi:hypothetical protein